MDVASISRCCFAGPTYDKTKVSEKAMKDTVKNSIEAAIADGTTTFIIGMNKGVDLIAGELLVDMREQDKSIKIICVEPYKHSNYSWQEAWKQTYNYVLAMADFRKSLSVNWEAGIYDKKLDYIIEHCDKAIILYDGDDNSDARYMLDKSIKFKKTWLSTTIEQWEKLEDELGKRIIEESK